MCLLDDQAAALTRGFLPSEDEEKEANRLVEAWETNFSSVGPRGDAMYLAGVEGFGERIIGPAAVGQARGLLDMAAGCAVREEERQRWWSSGLSRHPRRVPAPRWALHKEKEQQRPDG